MCLILSAKYFSRENTHTVEAGGQLRLWVLFFLCQDFIRFRLNFHLLLLLLRCVKLLWRHSVKRGSLKDIFESEKQWHSTTEGTQKHVMVYINRNRLGCAAVTDDPQISLKTKAYFYSLPVVSVPTLSLSFLGDSGSPLEHCHLLWERQGAHGNMLCLLKLLCGTDIHNTLPLDKRNHVAMFEPIKMRWYYPNRN